MNELEQLKRDSDVLYRDNVYLSEVCDAIRAENERLRARVAELEAERNQAISMLAAWCVAVDEAGSGWDDWDEFYKNAMYRPCPLRALLDAAITEERKIRAVEEEK